MAEPKGEKAQHFQSRYGQDSDGAPVGCPDGMYPWDVDYEGDIYSTFAEFKSAAYYDPLNLPISWYFNPADEGGEFVLVYVMPRKYGKTRSMRLAPGFDRAEVEAWLEDWTKQVASQHYGWVDPSSIPPVERGDE